MKNSKFTPGPWLAVYRPAMNLAGVHIKSTAQQSYGLDIGYCNSSETDRPEADAWLIAAAPELLETLEALLEVQPDEATSSAHADALVFAALAVRKARGEK